MFRGAFPAPFTYRRYAWHSVAHYGPGARSAQATHVAADRPEELLPCLFPSLMSPARTITDAAELGTVLGIWAHPDDEAFLSAGLMAAARDAGQRVVCVTATLGEHGTDDPAAGRRTAWRGSASASCRPRWPRWASPSTTCWASPTAPAPPHRTTLIVAHLARVIDVVAAGHDRHVRPGRHDRPRGPPDGVGVGDRRPRRSRAPDARLLYATTTEEFVQAWEPSREAFNVFLADGPAAAHPGRRPRGRAAPGRRHRRPQDRRAAGAGQPDHRACSRRWARSGCGEWWSTETFVEAHAARARAQAWGTWRVAA